MISIILLLGTVRNTARSLKVLSSKFLLSLIKYSSSLVALSKFNPFSDAIWSVSLERINIFDKKGALKNTVLFSDYLTNMLADKETLFVFGINKINAVSLKEGKLVKTWNLIDTVARNGVFNLQMVKRSNAQEGEGISLAPTYDVMSYYTYADDAWHTVTNADDVGAPKFVAARQVVSPDAFKIDKKTLGFMLLIGALVLVIFKISRSRKEQNLSITNGL